MRGKKPPSTEKTALHPRNQHRGAYDFPALVRIEPSLDAYVATNAYGTLSIDFANPAAVKALNRALLRYFYAVADWDIPAQYLCPPIPGRADYLHYLADLLAEKNAGEIPRGAAVRALDIGTGANLVYPLIGQHEYGWQFVGADIDAAALANGARILRANPPLLDQISLRRQLDANQIFAGMVSAEDQFDVTLCNPPFHASQAEARAGSDLKWRGLTASAGQQKGGRQAGSHAARQAPQQTPQQERKPLLNFGGHAAELYCPGGELAFIKQMIRESAPLAQQVFWFTSLVSKSANLPGIYRALEQAGVREQRTVAMAQGQKQSRFVAWTFLTAPQQQQWRNRRWSMLTR